MQGYTPTIGLEVHAELYTATKMFCSSKNDPDEERPNVNVCPVCLAHPGTLPVVNYEAVRHVLRVGAAISGTIADYSEFDRKNYFYPDLPKGYQISQYEFPLIKGGMLNGIEITRIHLEEDAATSKHQGTHSVVDFNRAGIPLMELVTEPVIHDAETASNFARELQLLLRTLGAGEANMEKGQMRFDANVSVSRDATLGSKIEIKNLNSFRSLERAIAYEIDRQTKVLEAGGTLAQETRGFNEVTGETISQRLKEASHDYRYFPDPDIPKFKLSLISEFSKEEIAKTLPELPWVRRARLVSEGLDAEKAEIVLTDKVYALTYEKAVASIGDAKARLAAANFLFGPIRGSNPNHELLPRLHTGLPSVAKLYAMGSVSSSAAVQILTEILATGGDAEQIAKDKQLIQNSDRDLVARIAEKLISDNAEVANQIRGGKVDAMKFLIGQGMKVSKGTVNPGVLEEELKKLLA